MINVLLDAVPIVATYFILSWLVFWVLFHSLQPVLNYIGPFSMTIEITVIYKLEMHCRRFSTSSVIIALSRVKFKILASSI